MSTDLENYYLNRGIVMGEARQPGHGLVVSGSNLGRALPDTELARQNRLAEETGEPIPRLGGTLAQELYRDAALDPRVVFEPDPETGFHETFIEPSSKSLQEIAELNARYVPALADVGNDSMNNPCTAPQAQDPLPRDHVDVTMGRKEHMARYEARVRQPDEDKKQYFSKRTMNVRRSVGSGMMNRPVGKRRIIGLRAGGGGGYKFVGPLTRDGEEARSTRNLYNEMD